MVTLKHGCPPMSACRPWRWPFKTKESVMVNSIKEGDNVKVRVENVDGTQILVKMAKQ
nr:copper-binding protein [Caballeronia insecticola]